MLPSAVVLNSLHMFFPPCSEACRKSPIMQKRFLIADTYRSLTAEMFVVLSSNDFFVPHFLVLHLFKCQLRV